MIKGIVCIGANGVMGKDGQMPWGDKPLDGAHFAELTKGQIVVMGRRTYQSIGHPLPNRANIVLTHNVPDHSVRNYGDRTLQFADSPYAAMGIHAEIQASIAEERDMWVIGGAKVFEEFLPLIDEMYVTTVGGKFEGDTFFPNMHVFDWESELLHMEDVAVLKPAHISPFHPEGIEPDRNTVDYDRYTLIYRKFTRIRNR